MIVAETEEKRECREMSQSRSLLDAEVARLDELKAYRKTYTASKESTGATVNPLHWQDYQKFLRRLDEAVALQKRHVSASQKKCDAHRQRWLLKRQKLISLEKVVERYKKTEREADERRQQKIVDDSPARNGLFRGN